MTTPEPDADGVIHVDTAPDPVSTETPESDDEGLDPRARAALQKVRSEAQNLRTRLRDAEEQLGAASARLQAHHRAAVAQAAAAAGLIDGNDLLAVHPDTSEFLDEQFADVIPDKVRDATEALLAQKPYLGRSVAPPRAQEIEGLRAGASPEQKEPPPPSWASALRGGL